jgi:tetratricopeptide (TPR) repeat protein
VELCSGFAGEVDLARQIAWAEAFRQGMSAYQVGDTVSAVARWNAANEVYAGRADAWYNLGVVHTHRGDLAAAAAAYRQVLAVLETRPADSAAAERENRADTRLNAISGLIGVGARMFARNEFDQTADLFRYVTTQDSTSRDAWYNYALALFKRSGWAELVPVATRLSRIDPLNENARIILFNAHRGLAEASPAASAESQEHRRQALAILEASDSLPIYIDEVRIPARNGTTRLLTGKATGNQAQPGQPLMLTFTLWGPDGAVGTASVNVSAPAKGEVTNFQLPLPGGVITSYSYTYR